jgi:hypothetical protein
MGIVNSTFSEPGAMPGQAKGWTIVSRCQAERWAAFGENLPTAYEDFERWSRLQLAFGAGQLVLGFFAPRGEGHEDFDLGWGNDIYQTELSPALSAAAHFGDKAEESFDWVTKLLVAWTDVVAAGAIFGGGTQSAEWFETAWANDTFRRNWTFVPSASALFGGVAVETFAGAWPHATTL